MEPAPTSLIMVQWDSIAIMIMTVLELKNAATTDAKFPQKLRGQETAHIIKAHLVPVDTATQIEIAITTRNVALVLMAPSTHAYTSVTHQVLLAEMFSDPLLSEEMQVLFPLDHLDQDLDLTTEDLPLITHPVFFPAE